MNDLVRLPDWETRLADLIAERWASPLEFGAHDCCLWGADVVDAQTGVDHGAIFRGTYTDAEGAAAALREHGGGTIKLTFDMFLPKRAVADLRRGDLAMTGKGRQAAVGVVIGAEALFIGAAGLERRERALWARGWGVG